MLPECVPISVGVSWKDEGEVVVSETFRNLQLAVPSKKHRDDMVDPPCVHRHQLSRQAQEELKKVKTVCDLFFPCSRRGACSPRKSGVAFTHHIEWVRVLKV